jgi:hypothetical protein
MAGLDQIEKENAEVFVLLVQDGYYNQITIAKDTLFDIRRNWSQYYWSDKFASPQQFIDELLEGGYIFLKVDLERWLISTDLDFIKNAAKKAIKEYSLQGRRLTFISEIPGIVNDEFNKLIAKYKNG